MLKGFSLVLRFRALVLGLAQITAWLQALSQASRCAEGWPSSWISLKACHRRVDELEDGAHHYEDIQPERLECSDGLLISSLAQTGSTPSEAVGLFPIPSRRFQSHGREQKKVVIPSAQSRSTTSTKKRLA